MRVVLDLLTAKVAATFLAFTARNLVTPIALHVLLIAMRTAALARLRHGFMGQMLGVFFTFLFLPILFTRLVLVIDFIATCAVLFVALRTVYPCWQHPIKESKVGTRRTSPANIDCDERQEK